VEFRSRTNKSLFKRFKLVAVVGCVEICGVGLTYESSRLSAMLDDVWRDVGNLIVMQFSTSIYVAMILSTPIDDRKLKVSNIPRMRLIRALSWESVLIPSWTFSRLWMTVE